MLSYQGRTIKDRMTKMNANHKIQKTTGGVVHLGSWMGNEDDPQTSKYGYFTPACGSGVVYAPATLRNIARFRELPQDTEVTCKKCLKMLQKAEELGLHLKVVANEDGSSKVVDTRKEDTAQHQTEAEAPTAPATVADQIAQIRANRDAEEEARAAARRARNRVNYAPAQEEKTEEPEAPAQELHEMDEAYGDLMLIGRGLRLLSDQLCQKIAKMKDNGASDDHPRLKHMRKRLVRSMELEDANLKARTALTGKIREAEAAKRERCLQRGAEGARKSLPCVHERGHTGDCHNSRGERFTNWLDPNDLKKVRSSLLADKSSAMDSLKDALKLY